MDIAFKKFFKGAGFPKFKSKHRGKQSFSIPQNVLVENNLLIIPKFKEGIDIVLHREIKGTIKSATISVTPTGKYFVSILVDTNTEILIKVPIKENTTIGIELSEFPNETTSCFSSSIKNRTNRSKVGISRSSSNTTTLPLFNNPPCTLADLQNTLLGGSACRFMKFGYMFGGSVCPLISFRNFGLCFSRVGFSEKGVKFSDSGFSMVGYDDSFARRSLSSSCGSSRSIANVISEFTFIRFKKGNPKAFSFINLRCVIDNFDNREIKSIPTILNNSPVKWEIFKEIPFSSMFSNPVFNANGLPNVDFPIECIPKHIDSRDVQINFIACFHNANIQKANDLIPDLGIKDFAITSEGEVFENPKNLRKAQSKLKYVQRKYSKHKGKRTKQRLALLHEKVVNKRKDLLHKTSTKLIRENQTICLEDLAVSNMVKNHNLAQAINDVSWSTFVTMLEYKSDWHGKNILRIGRFAPSSKTCSRCGFINKELTLKDREWTCPKCNSVLDRDVNAAINIKSFALKNHLSGEHTLKNQGKLPTLVGALTLEAHPISFAVGG